MEFRCLTKIGITVVIAITCAAGMSCDRGASSVSRAANRTNEHEQPREAADSVTADSTVRTLLEFDDQWVLGGRVSWNPLSETMAFSVAPRPRKGEAFPRVRMEYVFDLATGEWRELILSLSYFVPPQFTPDGRALVLLLPQSPYPIVQYDLASGTHEELYRPPAGWRPIEAKLSPDGQTLAVVDYEQQARQTELCLVPVAEENATPVTVPLEASEDMPTGGISWSPDSRLLLYSYRDPDKGHVFGFITVASLTVSDRLIPTYKYAYTRRGCWAPDAAGIVCFEFGQDQPEVAIDIVPAGRGERRRLLSMRDVWLDPMAGCVWSPAGGWIAFVAYPQRDTGARQYSLYLTSPAGGTPLRVLGPTRDQLQYLSWAPNGKQLAFIQNNSIKLLELSIAEGTE